MCVRVRVRVRVHACVCACLPPKVVKGAEHSYFAFGGSTVVLLFQRGRIHFDEDLVANTRQRLETKVRMGMQIGVAATPYG